MGNLFFAPVSSGELYKNFENTVVNGVSSSIIHTFQSKNKTTSVWGIRDAKKASFNKTKQDDFVCFYKEGVIIGYGEVAGTFVDEGIAKSLWGVFHNKQRNENYYWPNILVLKNYNTCTIPFSKFIELGGYSDKFSIRGYLMLNSIGIDKILNEYGTLESFFKNHKLKGKF